MILVKHKKKWGNYICNFPIFLLFIFNYNQLPLTGVVEQAASISLDVRASVAASATSSAYFLAPKTVLALEASPLAPITCDLAVAAAPAASTSTLSTAVRTPSTSVTPLTTKTPPLAGVPVASKSASSA